MRLSATQKDVLFVLYALRCRGNHAPMINTRLLQLINTSRSTAIHASNFRQSCHTLHAYQFLHQYRQPSQELAWQLTERGGEAAQLIYQQRTGCMARDDS